MSWRLGVDIGGTFTDVVLAEEGGARIAVVKVSTTPRDFARGVLEALRAALANRALAPADVTFLAHATTVVTNALLEGKGARAALITTRGFRDVLELRRSARASLYDLFQDAPAVLVPRHHRLEITERVDAQGAVVVPLSEEDIDDAIDFIKRHDIEAVAVCLLYSFLNDAHERAIGARLRAALPDRSVFLSSEVLPEIREFERTSTTAVCAYVGPVLASYLGRLEASITGMGLPAPYIMGSGGGLFTVEEGLRMPAMAVESGPAAGVIAAALAGKQLGLANLISFDMGGTTAKVSLIEGGEIKTTSEYEVGGGAHARRWLSGTGHPIRVPVIDLAEVSAGGGSIAWIDPAGALRVGPRSAGAEPGPACYGQGGEEPTVTDADLVLGHLNPVALLGGGLPVHLDRSRSAIETRIARPLGLDPIRAAAAITDVVHANMAAALRIVSVERGYDPREFTLVAFGGGGPVHAARLAEELEIRQVVVPPIPGGFSALGLVASDIRRDYARTLYTLLRDASPAAVGAACEAMEAAARDTLARAGVPPARQEIARSADLRYRRQAYELTVPMAPGPVTAATLAQLAADFHDKHRLTYGHASADEAVQLVHLRVSAIGRLAGLALGGGGAATASAVTDAQAPSRAGAFGGATAKSPAARGFAATRTTSTAGAFARAQTQSSAAGARTAYFKETGPAPCPVLPRDALAPGDERAGPLIVEAADTTIVVPPRWRLRAAAGGFILLEAPHA
jgi:N-methylhydantoinase A